MAKEKLETAGSDPFTERFCDNKRRRFRCHILKNNNE